MNIQKCGMDHEIEIDGFVQRGKEFDIEISGDEDRRNAVYGVIKDECGEPIENAVVKLIEIDEEERKPVSHTFTDEFGEFLFGPLCPDRKYEILFWANKVKNIKIEAKAERTRKCLKGVKLDCTGSSLLFHKHGWKEENNIEKGPENNCKKCD